MKKYKFNCDFEIRSSHDISGVGFSGSSIVTIEEISFVCPFGLPNTYIAIAPLNNSLYSLSIESFDLTDQKCQVKYLSELSVFLSFLIGKNELSGHSGTPYVYIKFETFFSKEEIVQEQKLNDNNLIINDFLHVTDSLSIQSTQHIKFEESSLKSAFNHETVQMYHNGLKAESESSKFFHWFLILEFLESSPLYEYKFPIGTMFDDSEKTKITELAATFSDDKEKALLSVLNRTAEYRAKKLIDLLDALQIKNISNMTGNHDIKIDDIREIIKVRNKLFHRGKEFPKCTLWLKLFPIVTKVVEKLIYDKECVEKCD